MLNYSQGRIYLPFFKEDLEIKDRICLKEKGL